MVNTKLEVIFLICKHNKLTTHKVNCLVLTNQSPVMIKREAILWGIAIWVITTVTFSMFNAPANGFTSIGFPWRFYSYSTMESSQGSAVKVGFILTYFLFDLIALLAFIILFSIFLLNRRKQLKTS
jgi:uncharacterized membrane protein